MTMLFVLTQSLHKSQRHHSILPLIIGKTRHLLDRIKF